MVYIPQQFQTGKPAAAPSVPAGPPRGAAPVAAAPMPNSSADYWECGKCNWVNHTSEASCKACHLVNPNPVTLVPSAPAVPASLSVAQYTSFTQPFVLPAATAPTAPYEVAIATPVAATTRIPMRPPASAPVPVQVQAIPGRIPAPIKPKPAQVQVAKPPAQAPAPAAKHPSVFRIRENKFGFGDNFTIQDKSGKPHYQVKGKVFSFGDQLSLRDMQGHKVAYISQARMTFQPQYDILDGTKQHSLGRMVKEYTFFHKAFTLTVPGIGRISIEGSFFAHNFTFASGGRCLARVSKKRFAWSDSYSVEILSSKVDAKLILCACIIVDQVLRDD